MRHSERVSRGKDREDLAPRIAQARQMYLPFSFVDIAEILLEVLLILAFAKIGAEISERINVPAVIGEITAGLILGPSLLNWVHLSESIRFLAEFGVILLLLQVGMEMDLREMRKVGGSALGVAIVGIVAPMAMGYGVAVAFGEGTNQALFLGASLAATSVGITARAFGDLKILSSIESRVVLSAAVVDDVLGLIILTVVVGIVESGALDIGEAGKLLLYAILFLSIATALGIRLAPPAFQWLQRNARGSGTMLIAALVVTLALAFLAHEIELAVIIGAFVAGLALGRTKQAERIERDLYPLAQFFVPIFFVSVGLEVDVGSMIQPQVLALAGALLVVAIVGKVAGGYVIRNKGIDKFLVGVGMVPRGEVGLIFAAIGLATGTLDSDLYAALLVVVLVTTVITPPLISMRIKRQRAKTEVPTTTVEPRGGWLKVQEGVVELNAAPADSAALGVALEAARLVAENEPDSALLEWIDQSSDGEHTWTPDSRRRLVRLLSEGNRRSWRLLDATGFLSATLPDLADELDHRRHDTTLLDPAMLMRLPVVERLTELIGPDGDARARSEVALLEDTDLLYLSALALDLASGYEDAPIAAKDLSLDIRMPQGESFRMISSAEDAAAFRIASAQVMGLAEGMQSEAMTEIDTVERARRGYLLALALGFLNTVHRNAIDELYEGVLDGVEQPSTD